MGELSEALLVVLETSAFAVGAVFCLLAGVGILRMPDIYTRMQASTKAGTLGIASIIIGVGLHFGDTFTGLEAGLVVAFLFLTAPIASHLIARAAYILGVRQWNRHVLDDMEHCYCSETGRLRNPDEVASVPSVPGGDPSASAGSVNGPDRPRADGNGFH